jgi:hypothetical protein
MSQRPDPTVSCAEFQEQLPELFASGNSGIAKDPVLQAHLDTCDNCSALVRDLQYIADQARKLLEPAEEEPSDNVWASIQNKLRSEGNEGGSSRFSIAPPLPS